MYMYYSDSFLPSGLTDTEKQFLSMKTFLLSNAQHHPSKINHTIFGNWSGKYRIIENVF